MPRFRLGDPIVVKRPITIPYVAIPITPGLSGRIVDVDPENGDVIALLDQPHPGLEAARNTICVPCGAIKRANAPTSWRLLAATLLGVTVFGSVSIGGVSQEANAVIATPAPTVHAIPPAAPSDAACHVILKNPLISA